MPKLSDAAQAERIMQVMMALQLHTRGFSKEDACQESGISTWQYDTWLAKGENVIESLQKDIAEAERIRLATMVHAQTAALGALVSLITKPEFTDPDILIKFLRYLDPAKEKLEAKHGVHSKRDTADDYLQLTGPETRPEQSQMTVEHELSRSVVNIKTKPDGSVDLTLPTQTTIVDVFPDLVSEDDVIQREEEV